jgi:glycosyltransferase involved in cell wall biosynthesis
MLEPKLLSVVVCTFNRADLLPGCLESLAEQTADKSSYEVIVVNNNSTDTTEEIAESFTKREPNFRMVMEFSQGLSHARNRGWRDARGRYVAYIDDDARAERDWLINAMRVITDHAPDIFGGPIYPFYLTQKPRWFNDAYEIRQTSDTPRNLGEKEYISGSNLIITRSLLEMLGGFRVDLGMQGNTLAYGEETELMIRARKVAEKCEIYYDPAVRVRHLVPEHKMHVGYFIKSKWTVGRKSPDIFQGQRRGGWRAILSLLRTIVKIIYAMLLGWFVRDRSIHPYWQNYVVERVAPLFGALGRYMVELKR